MVLWLAIRFVLGVTPDPSGLQMADLKSQIASEICNLRFRAQRGFRGSGPNQTPPVVSGVEPPLKACGNDGLSDW
jgi:hypothetical protein